MLSCKCVGGKVVNYNENHLRVRADTVGQHKIHSYIKLLDIKSSKINISPQFYYNSCYCNEFNAITKRHALGNLAAFIPDNEYFKLFENELNYCATTILNNTQKLFDQCDYHTVIENTRSAVKKRYKTAYHNIVHNRISYSDLLARGSSFVKYEKMDYSKLEENKPPRLIQHRTFEYLYMLKSYILSYDLYMKNATIEFNNQPVKTIFSKLHNDKENANILRGHWESFKNPVAFCLDHSKFDGHYSKEMLISVAKNYWNRLYKSKLLARMLKHQVINKFRTLNGLNYKTKGTRCSGEYTTSDENSIANYAMLAVWLKASNINDFKIVVNGDDSVVFIDMKDENKLKSTDFFLNFNMETEVDRICYDFNKISFCQASPIKVIDGYTMIKDPHRTISRSCYTSFCHLKHLNTLMTADGLCQLAQHQGIPILQDHAINFILMGGFNKPLRSVDKIPARRSGNISKTSKILYQTRCDFEVAFGININDQLDVERDLAGELIIDPNYQSELNKFLIKYQSFLTEDAK